MKIETKVTEARFIRANKFYPLLGMGKSAFYEAVRKGEINHVKIAGCILIPRKELDRLERKAMGAKNG